VRCRVNSKFLARFGRHYSSQKFLEPSQKNTDGLCTKIFVLRRASWYQIVPPPPPLDILFVSNTYRIFQLQIDNMADTVEPVEAETMTGEMWSDKKATLLAVVQAN
jgi:hypothetical protein